MQGPDYIFAIMTPNNLFWQPDGMGGAVLNPNPYFLKFSPDGWADISIQNVRNMRLWGIDRSVTLPLSYINDGALILKNLFYRLGTETSANLVICKQEIEYVPGVYYNYWYRQIYKGAIDLTTGVHLGVKFTCTTLEDGLPQHFKSNEATVYELPLNVVDAVAVQMDGINLHQAAHYGFVDGINYNQPLYALNFIFTGADGDGYGVENISEANEPVPNTQGQELNSEIYYCKNSTNYFFKNINKTAVSILLKGTVQVQSNQNGTQPLSGTRLRVKSSMPNSTGGTLEYLLIPSFAPVAGTIYPYIINQTIIVSPGERLFVLGNTASNNSTLYDFEFLPNSNLTLTYITRKPATYIQAFRPQYLFSQFINKVTEGQFTADISAYFTRYQNITFTCGNGIRGMSDAVVKMSLADFFQFWDSFDSVAITQNQNTVLFDSKVNSVDKNTIINLQNVSNFKTYIYKSLLYNELEIGYTEIKNEVGALNGNQETNCKILFSIGTVKSPAKINKVSKIKASPYEIEKIRTTILPKDSTDYKSDNDNFIIVIADGIQPINTGSISPYYLLDRSLNSTATGILEAATIFNIAVSPKRMLLNNGPFLRSCMFMCDNKILAYKSSDKNNKMICNGVVEKADIQLSLLGDRIFHPLVMEFDTPVTDNLIELLDADPLQIFRVLVDGNYYTGIPLKVSISPSNKKKQTYQLLALPENDLTQLIEYNG